MTTKLDGLIHQRKNGLTHRSQVKRDGDVVELVAIGECGTLPPLVAAVDGVGDGVVLQRLLAPRVANVAVAILRREDLHVLHQLAEHFRLALSARGVRADPCARGEVEHYWEQPSCV